uniref:Uncharacterized protein n=1 Tax=Candidatus Methanogaster sp. ANME-2c ERB4 TaxID=2759911 RepID=A0A7G9YPA5_9EURY|nr:hypothetical protein DBPBNLAN_00049 [Methanosarcinales archaeon ANME-2c ERB4]QNO49979.1 hypothetical protein FNHNGOKL_00047 [Methanosarcinales archaeon ANME-2c ERB4]
MTVVRANGYKRPVHRLIGRFAGIYLKNEIRYCWHFLAISAALENLKAHITTVRSRIPRRSYLPDAIESLVILYRTPSLIRIPAQQKIQKFVP